MEVDFGMTLIKAAPPPSPRPPKKLGNLEKAGKQKLKGGGGGGGQSANSRSLEVSRSGQLWSGQGRAVSCHSYNCSGCLLPPIYPTSIAALKDEASLFGGDRSHEG